MKSKLSDEAKQIRANPRRAAAIMKKLRDEVNRLTELYDEAFLIVAVVEAKNERLRTMLAKCAQAMADAAEKEGA
jgi:ABC-type transporter Mla subunit MlaD